MVKFYNQAAIVKYFIIFIWIVAYILNSFLPFSRSFYYVNTSSEFLRKFDVYYNSSLIAVDNIERWILENRFKQIKTKLFNQENHEKLFCVGMISKERKGINTVIPSVTSLLTRIKLKHEDRVDFTLFNVDDNTKRHDLISLSKFVNVEDLKNSFGSRIYPFAYNAKVSQLNCGCSDRKSK